MSELTEQLDKMIQQAALDGALTTKAVDQFHSLVHQCDEQAEELRSLTKVKTELIDQRDQLKIDLGLSKTLVELAAKAEVEMIEREKNITTLELTAQHHEQRVVDHQFMFTTVFRNSVLRKEVMTPTNSTVDQYGSRQTDFPSKDTVEEEEG